MSQARHNGKPNRKRADRPRVLIVDDELPMAEMLADGLTEHGYDAVPLSSSVDAAQRLRTDRFDALVTDLRMPQQDGLALLELSMRVAPGRPVVIMTAYSAVDSAVESIRRGAYHYLTKPFKVDELALFLDRAIDEAQMRSESRSLKQAINERWSLANFVGQSDAMRSVYELITRLADSSVPVLILGETGTGKGLVARAIHAHGPRADARFVTVNCAALPENLLESELFGHLKGAFTGATAHRTGLFEEANHGTLFLDEVAELSQALQAKLLDVLERGVVRAVGSNREREIDVRVIAATHRDLHARVASAEFREDLLYRLDVVAVDLPPLRARREDIPALLTHFLQQALTRHPRSEVQRFSDEALERLMRHRWPGNIRELEHLVERMVVLSPSAEIRVRDLPGSVDARSDDAPLDFGNNVLPLREVQRRYVAWAYEQLGERKLLTAERLGIDDKTLTKWLTRDTEKPGS
jgi:two-component system response regulator HydG